MWFIDAFCYVLLGFIVQRRPVNHFSQTITWLTLPLWFESFQSHEKRRNAAFGGGGLCWSERPVTLSWLRFRCPAPRRCLQGIHCFVQPKDGVERTKGVLWWSVSDFSLLCLPFKCKTRSFARAFSSQGIPIRFHPARSCPPVESGAVSQALSDAFLSESPP